ncbi:MAG: DUF4339 domain-containing protein [Thermoguttaceae bacterium]|nr:DUF4339 domain-containing protein [Thermoguttaceae bacterium]
MDPLDEAPTAVWYVRPSAGGQYGPATREIMRVWLAEGRVGPDSLVWREGWRDWRLGSQVFPQLAAADDEVVPGLRHIIEEEVFAVGPVATSPGVGSRRPAEQGGNTAAVLVVAALALVGMIVAALWYWLGSGEGP